MKNISTEVYMGQSLYVAKLMMDYAAESPMQPLGAIATEREPGHIVELSSLDDEPLRTCQ